MIAYPNQVIGADVPRYNLLRVALNANISDFSWCALVCGYHEKSLEMLANLEDFDIDEREIILEKFILAKSLWTCRKCKDFSSMESMLSGFIICRLCQHWFHRNCSVNKENAQSAVVQSTDEFVCERCVSMFFAGESEQSVKGEEIIASQDALQLQTIAIDAPVSVHDGMEKNYIVENIEASSKLSQGEHIEFIQAQSSTQAHEITEDQITSSVGPQIYYQLPPNMSFPSTGEGHYVVQLEGNTVHQIGYEVL